MEFVDAEKSRCHEACDRHVKINIGKAIGEIMGT